MSWGASLVRNPKSAWGSRECVEGHEGETLTRRNFAYSPTWHFTTRLSNVRPNLVSPNGGIKPRQALIAR